MTNSALPVAEADITHRRRHAIIETTFADLIDGPLADIPRLPFAANCVWLACAVITHNLLRAAGNLAGGGHHARPAPDPAPRPGQRARPLRRPGPQTHAAPASPLALANRMESPGTTSSATPPSSHEPPEPSRRPRPPRHPRPDPRTAQLHSQRVQGSYHHDR